MRKAIAAFAVMLACAAARADDQTLYQQFGEREGLSKIVEDTTDLWTRDPRIKDTFDDVNLARFKGLLLDQLCELVGGPCKYKGRDMYKSHKGLHLDEAEFAALTEDLQITMDKLDVPQSAQFRLIAMLAPMEKDIVTRHHLGPETP
jgi:hemoglobin